MKLSVYTENGPNVKKGVGPHCSLDSTMVCHCTSERQKYLHSHEEMSAMRRYLLDKKFCQR